MAEYRSNDPFRPLLSLADQKLLDVSSKLTEKKIAQAPSEKLLPDGGVSAAMARMQQGGAEAVGLGEIAKSSIYQGNTRLFDFLHGRTTDPEDLQRIADSVYGVTPEDRQRLVTNDQQEVMQSLAEGNYLDAFIGGVKAAPGTLADSANVVPDIAAGAAATILTGGAAAPVVAGQKLKKGAKLFDSIGNAIDSAKKQRTRAQAVKEAAKTLPKTAGQMSIVTADITQGQIAEYEQEFGERPSAAHIAQMYGINLVTMTAEGGIIKNLFIPDFKKELKDEAIAVMQNVGSGNLAHIGRRVGDAIKKVGKAAGAEAAQEYAQTWAEIINTSIGENESFVGGLRRELSDADNRLQALAGSFLGFGAGGLARGAIAAPAVAAGTAVDTAKGTIATAAKTTKKAASRISGELSYKVLSAEERQVIRDQYESEKVVFEQFEKKLQGDIDSVKKADTIADVRAVSPGVEKVANEIQQKLDMTDEDLTGKNLFRLKDAVIRAAKADIATSKFALEAKPAATVAAKSAKNIGAAADKAARKAVSAVSPGLEVIQQGLKDLGLTKENLDAAIKATKEIRSSTALGVIELSAQAGKEQISQIKEAANTLSLDDLRRTRAVVAMNKAVNPEVQRILDTAVRAKEKRLEETGGLKRTIVTGETLDPQVSDFVSRPSLQPDDVARASSVLGTQTASKIGDLPALEALEQLARLVENSAGFKNQTRGAPSTETIKVINTRLERARARIEKDIAQANKSAGTKAGEAAKAAVDKVADVAEPVTRAAKSAAKKAKDTVEKRQRGKAEEKFTEIYTPEFVTSMETFSKVAEKTAGDPTKTAKAIELVPAQIAAMKEAGITTRADFEVFLETFPDMQVNTEVIKEFEKDPNYGSNLIVDEVFDTFKGVLYNLPQQIKDAYNAINPPECKV